MNIIEKLIDRAARQCGFDRADLRRRNMVAADAMPMTNALGFVVDSGHFVETLDTFSRQDGAVVATNRNTLFRFTPGTPS